MATVRDDGIVDLTGRGLQFLLSFDMSQARRSIEEITPTMDGFLKVLKTMKDDAAATAQTIGELFKNMSAHTGDMGLMAMIGGDPSKMADLSAAVTKFHREAQAGARQTQQEYATLFREILRLAGGFDEAGKANEKLNASKPPSAPTKLPGVPSPGDEGGGGGGGNGALGAASGLAGMVGIGTAVSKTMETATDLSEVIQRLGQQFKLNDQEIAAWKQGIVDAQSAVGGTTKELIEITRVIMQTSERLHTVDMAKPFVEAAEQVSRLTGVSGTEVAKLLAQYEKFGLVTKDTVKDFVGDMYEAAQKGAGSFGDIAKNVGEAGKAVQFFYTQSIQPGGAFAGKRDEAREYFRNMAVEMASLMSRLNSYGVESSIVTKAGEAMRAMTSDQMIQLRQFLQSATNMTEEESGKLAQALQMGDVSTVIQQLAKSVQGIPGGWERITKDLPQMFAGAVSDDVLQMFSALRAVPLEELGKLKEILPGIVDGVRSLDDGTKRYNNSLAGSKRVFGEAIDSLRTMHAQWLDNSGVGKAFYDVLTSIVNVLKEFPALTRIAAGLGLMATSAVTLSGAFRLVGAAAPWLATVFPKLAGLLGVGEGAAAAAGGGGLIAGFSGLASAVGGFVSSLLSVRTIGAAAVMALGYLIIKLTGLDEKFSGANWAKAFTDLKDEASATIEVLKQDLTPVWNRAVEMADAVGQKLAAWKGYVEDTARAILNLVPGGEALKNALNLNPKPGAGAAGGGKQEQTNWAKELIEGVLAYKFPLPALAMEAYRLWRQTDIENEKTRQSIERGMSEMGKDRQQSSGSVDRTAATPMIDTGSIARQIALQLPVNAPAASAKGVVESGMSIRQVTDDITQQALMAKIASMAGDISVIAQSTSAGGSLAATRTAPQAIVAAPRTQAISAVDTNKVTFEQLQALISAQANASKPTPFPDSIKADTSELAQVIREVAAQVANQIGMGQQSARQTMPAPQYDAGAPWSPKVTSGMQEA